MGASPTHSHSPRQQIHWLRLLSANWKRLLSYVYSRVCIPRPPCVLFMHEHAPSTFHALAEALDHRLNASAKAVPANVSEVKGNAIALRAHLTPPDVHHPHLKQTYHVATPPTGACRLDHPCVMGTNAQTTHAPAGVSVFGGHCRKGPKTRVWAGADLQNFARRAHCAKSIPKHHSSGLRTPFRNPTAPDNRPCSMRPRA